MSRIAFGSERGRWGPWVVRADGTGERRLATNIAAKGSRGWSPDGTRIAFQSVRGKEYDIEVVRIADGTRTKLTETALGE